jgi:hypothetical protein
LYDEAGLVYDEFVRWVLPDGRLYELLLVVDFVVFVRVVAVRDWVRTASVWLPRVRVEYPEVADFVVPVLTEPEERVATEPAVGLRVVVVAGAVRKLVLELLDTEFLLPLTTFLLLLYTYSFP